MPVSKRPLRQRKTRRKGPRLNLGIGDYEWTGASLNSYEYARDCFIEAVRVECPESLADLQTRALQVCRDFMADRDRYHGGVKHEDWEDLQDDGEPDSEPGESLRTAVRDWEAHWHLAAPWMRERVLHSLAAWVEGMPRDHWHAPGLSTGGGRLEGDPDFVFTARAWRPIAERWVDWLFHTSHQFLESAKHYHSVRESQARRIGMVRTKEWTEDAFRWLAWFQVSGQRYDEIAGRVNITDKAIYTAVAKLARLIGLRLRRQRTKRRERRRSR